MIKPPGIGPEPEGGPVAAGGKNRADRAARERSRLYEARKAFHEGRERRRRRDNLVAGIAGGALILAVVAGQTAYFVAGPGAPTPEPTPTATPTPTGTTTPGPTPASTETPAPSPSATE
jgi:peptidyl-prolyl cis-trans isomerase B (cyclophilin B)